MIRTANIADSLEGVQDDILKDNLFEGIVKALVTYQTYGIRQMQEPAKSLSASKALRNDINNNICTVVQKLTAADCVYIRRLRTDKSVLLHTSLVYGYNVKPEGVVPVVVGINSTSSHILNRDTTESSVIADVTSPDINPYYSNHADSISDFGSHSGERKFLNWVRADVCVPLLDDHGVTIAGVIAVRGNPYSDSEVATVKERLRLYQRALSTLYFTGLSIDRRDSVLLRLHRVTHVASQLPSSMTRNSFLRRAVAILTAWEGPRWHRVFLFEMQNDNEPQAVCTIAYGHTGDKNWPRWVSRLDAKDETLENWVASAHTRDFGLDDALYEQVINQSVGSNGEPLIAMSSSCFDEGSPLVKLFTDNTNTVGHIKLTDSHHDMAWLRNITGHNIMFPSYEVASTDHYLFGIRHPISRTPLAIVLLDNPYPHPLEKSIQLELTRVVCDYMAFYLAYKHDSMQETEGH